MFTPAPRFLDRVTYEGEFVRFPAPHWFVMAQLRELNHLTAYKAQRPRT